MSNVDVAALQAQLEQLQAENDKLKARESGELSLQVSQKGAVSVYGMGRFPVTLYANQFERLLGHADQIRQFITDNADRLSRKE